MNKNLPAVLTELEGLLKEATPDCSCGLPTCLGCKADWDVSVQAHNALPLLIEAIYKMQFRLQSFAQGYYGASDNTIKGAQEILIELDLTDTEGK